MAGRPKEYFNTISETLKRVEVTPTTNATDDERRVPLFNQVSDVMSDRCATNKLVEDLIEESKGESVNRFKCAMHPLDALAKACDKTLKSEEDHLLGKSAQTGAQPFLHGNESHTQALVRATSKLFHNTKYNCRAELSANLRTRNCIPPEDALKSVLFHRFVGNRFHVYFLNCALLYHYSAPMTDFFTDIHTPTNVVQSCVRNSLQMEGMRVTLRAMGIIGKLVTGPWMRMLSTCSTVLDLNEHFLEAPNRIREWSDDSSSMLCSASSRSVTHCRTVAQSRP